MTKNKHLTNLRSLLKRQQLPDDVNLDWVAIYKFWLQFQDLPIKSRRNASKRIRLNKEIKSIILNRSGGLCEKCHKTAKAIHHLKSVSLFPQFQFDIDNLIHLCNNCHKRMHRDLPDILFREQPTKRKPFMLEAL